MSFAVNQFFSYGLQEPLRAKYVDSASIRILDPLEGLIVNVDDILMPSSGANYFKDMYTQVAAHLDVLTSEEAMSEMEAGIDVLSRYMKKLKLVR